MQGDLEVLHMFGPEPVNIVIYYGIQLRGVRNGWLHLERDGTLYWTELEPTLHGYSRDWEWHSDSEFRVIALVKLNDVDWRESKVEVGNSSIARCM